MKARKVYIDKNPVFKDGQSGIKSVKAIASAILCSFRNIVGRRCISMTYGDL